MLPDPIKKMGKYPIQSMTECCRGTPGLAAPDFTRLNRLTQLFDFRASSKSTRIKVVPRE